MSLSLCVSVSVCAHVWQAQKQLEEKLAQEREAKKEVYATNMSYQYIYIMKNILRIYTMNVYLEYML